MKKIEIDGSTLDDSSISEMPLIAEQYASSEGALAHCRGIIVEKFTKGLQAYLNEVNGVDDDDVVPNRILASTLIKHLQSSRESILDLLSFLRQKLTNEVKTRHNVIRERVGKYHAEPDEQVNRLYNIMQALIFDGYRIYSETQESIVAQNKTAHELLAQTADPQKLGSLEAKVAELETSKRRYRGKITSMKKTETRLNEAVSKLEAENRGLQQKCEQLEKSSGSSDSDVAKAKDEARRWEQKYERRKAKDQAEIAELKAELKQAQATTLEAYKQNNQQLALVQNDTTKQLAVMHQQQKDSMAQVCMMFEFLIKTKGGTVQLEESNEELAERLLADYPDMNDIVEALVSRDLMSRPRAELIWKLMQQYKNTEDKEIKLEAILRLATQQKSMTELVSNKAFGIAVPSIDEAHLLNKDAARIIKFIAVVAGNKLGDLALCGLLMKLSNDVQEQGLAAVLNQNGQNAAASHYVEIDGSNMKRSF